MRISDWSSDLCSSDLLPISETLGVVASEIPGPVGEEFKLITERIKIGRTMDAALQETADRLGTPEFQFFVITLTIQRATGGHLAETLSNLADVLRKRAPRNLTLKALQPETRRLGRACVRTGRTGGSPVH